ncbi:hypothetical protein RJ640_009506 [Escallonia rubra]|uniref:SAC domain-containing protein n=1 Tax=Escallonia rubra TaxID=112253 RepID=A0AA88QY25_9ASTE|nr:hypothetical protein RJ640_009506 [Escallonia rubra]
MAKSDNPKSNSSNLPPFVPPAAPKIDQTNDPETDYSLEKFKLYETRARFYLIGSDRNKRFFRVLKIDRMEPSDLNISEDPVVYPPQEVKSLLQRIAEGNRATGGLTFSFYLILVTKRRQIGCICGHAIYSIDESQIISVPHVSVQTDVAHSKTEQRYKKLLSSVDLTKDFFYSYTYPIMQSLQKNVLSMGEEGMPYESIFVWNAFLTQEIRSRCKNTIWTIALVHGNFKQPALQLNPKDASPCSSSASSFRLLPHTRHKTLAYTSSLNLTLTLPWAASGIVFYAASDLVSVALHPCPVLHQHGHSRDVLHKQSLASLSASSSASRVAMALVRISAASSSIAPGSRTRHAINTVTTVLSQSIAKKGVIVSELMESRSTRAADQQQRSSNVWTCGELERRTSGDGDWRSGREERPAATGQALTATGERDGRPARSESCAEFLSEALNRILKTKNTRLSIFGRDFSVSLISRRSRHFAGTRYALFQVAGLPHSENLL